MRRWSVLELTFESWEIFQGGEGGGEGGGRRGGEGKLLYLDYDFERQKMKFSILTILSVQYDSVAFIHFVMGQWWVMQEDHY